LITLGHLPSVKYGVDGADDDHDDYNDCGGDDVDNHSW